MQLQETAGKLILSYQGDSYPNGERQCLIKFLSNHEGEQWFEFDFAFPQSPTHEKVICSVQEESKERIINPFNLQYMQIDENDWVLRFEIVEELAHDAEYFTAFARFQSALPRLHRKRFIDLRVGV